ncbi:MAG: hypothetical protein IJ191_08810 [Treponema sp.]|nr:hypothetical protein [Treponema sp.]
MIKLFLVSCILFLIFSPAYTDESALEGQQSFIQEGSDSFTQEEALPQSEQNETKRFKNKHHQKK